MTSKCPDTAELLTRVASGDMPAREQLLAQHRARLRQMVAVRMDPLVAARVDPSDVVQEALVEASRRLPDYVQKRPMPFYPWLRQIAWEQLTCVHQRHVQAQKRSVQREHSPNPFLPDESAMHLADRLLGSGTSPSGRFSRKESRERVRAALSQLADRDREVLVLWYLEELSTQEIAAVLGITESGVKSRHRRALERLAPLLCGHGRESST